MVAFSVIMACFNSQTHLARSIASLQSQTLQDWELIAVDDASSDGTSKALRAFAAEDDRVSVLQLPQNRGPSAARNTALGAASGEWLAILDADDAFEPARLAMMLQASAGHDMVFDNLVLWDDALGLATSKTNVVTMSNENKLTAVELLGSEGPTSRFKYGFLKPIIRKEFLIKNSISYDENLRLAEDFDLYARCLLHGARATIVPEALYIYTTQLGGASGQRSTGTRTTFTPHVRISLAERLLSDFSGKISDYDQRALNKYAEWQRIYSDSFDLAKLRKSWKVGQFISLSFRSPRAFLHFCNTSRAFRKISSVFQGQR